MPTGSPIFGLLAFAVIIMPVRADKPIPYAYDTFIQVYQPLVESYAVRPEIIQALKQVEELTQNIILQRDKHWKANQKLRQTISNHVLSQEFKKKVDEEKNNIREIILIDKNGVVIASHPITSDYYQGDEEKFIQPSTNKLPFHDTPDWDDSSNSPTIQIAVPIFDNNKQFLGVLVEGIEVNLNILTKIKIEK